MGATGMWVRKVDLSTGSDPLTVVVVEGTDRRNLVLDHFPFTVGRRTDRDLVLTDPRVSREHAQLIRENDGIYIEDQNSRQGTFVNGERTTRKKLTRNDRLEFGVQGASFVLFNPDRSVSSIAQQFISQFSSWKPSTGAGSDFEMLNVFLEAARKSTENSARRQTPVTSRRKIRASQLVAVRVGVPRTGPCGRLCASGGPSAW